MEICVIEPGGAVAPFLKLTGEAAVGLPERGNELAGVVFDPSGGGMYFGAQRAFGLGAVYEVTGPFREAGRAPRAPARRGRRRRAPLEVPAGRVRRGSRSPRCAARARRRGPRSTSRAELRVALRTDALEERGGRRGSTARPKTVTLDRRRLRRPRGRHGPPARRAPPRRAGCGRRAPRTLQVAITVRAAASPASATRRVRLR